MKRDDSYYTILLIYINIYIYIYKILTPHFFYPSKIKLKSEITEILGEKMGMKVFGEDTVIEVKNHGFKAICPQISAKISRAKPVRAAPLEGF